MTLATQPQGSPPGVTADAFGSWRTYLVGLAFALVLTCASFWAASTHLVYPAGVPILLAVLAIAQMGVHIVFFLHISSAPDQTNNLLSLAFGVFVVGLVVFGSLIIMANLNHTEVSMQELMRMHR